MTTLAVDDSLELTLAGQKIRIQFVGKSSDGYSTWRCTDCGDEFAALLNDDTQFEWALEMFALHTVCTPGLYDIVTGDRIRS